MAIARALVFEPRVLLMDEPLSNLDAKLREQMRVVTGNPPRHRVSADGRYVVFESSATNLVADQVDPTARTTCFSTTGSPGQRRW